MKATRTAIPDVWVIEPTLFEDERGLFFESFNEKKFNELVGNKLLFVQDNHSLSKRNVLRGLHYQLPPKAQGKLVRVVSGEIYGVAVDIRKKSITYGNWVGEKLSSNNKKQLWIPPGFAHGFLTLSDQAEVLYKTTDYYSPTHEQILIWNDLNLNINWCLEAQPMLAAKDANGKTFGSCEFFE